MRNIKIEKATQKQIEQNEIEEIIKSGKRENAGKTLPPNGLYLLKVVY
jgi:tRNA U38,U39,U40 pseudouridine synthase TruA